MKKIVALVLALIMSLSLASVAFADGPVEIADFAGLEAAAAAGGEYVLTADISGSGIVITNDIIIDFNGHTFSIDAAPTVGSAGTESQGIQILADNATFMNGTITSTLPYRQGETGNRSGIAVLVNSYAELNLIDMVLDTTNANYYTLQIQDGVVIVEGDTTIGNAAGPQDPDVADAPETGYSVCVSEGASSDYSSAIIFADNFTGVVEGDIYVGEDAEVAILNGTFNGGIEVEEGATNVINVEGGLFEDDSFLAYTAYAPVQAPGEDVVISYAYARDTYKVSSYDFTTGAYNGASYIEEIKINKDNELVLTLKENYTLAVEKELSGKIVLQNKTTKDKVTISVAFTVTNTPEEIQGGRKASEATDLNTPKVWGENVVLLMDEDGGYVSFAEETLSGVVKMEKEEKAYLNIFYGYIEDVTEDTIDAFEAYVGEEYVDDAIIEYYTFETRAFKNEVAFAYDAWEDDDHYFYLWDGEKLTAIDAKYDDDEDVEAYVWEGIAEGTIIVTDVEIVLAAEDAATKNPDTGATDVVGMASALAVVSLIAAGAVALKK